MSQPDAQRSTVQYLVADPAPCHGCRFATRCKARLQAGEAFSMYLAGKVPAHWRVAPQAPTRARYQALFEHPLQPLTGRVMGSAAGRGRCGLNGLAPA
jgi:hypothetical protein